MSVNVTAPPIKAKGQLKKSLKQANIKASIVTELNKIPDVASMKNSASIVEYICNFIENSCGGSKKFGSKQDFAVSVCQTVWPNLSVAEVAQLRTLIDYICQSGVIKKKPLLFFLRRLVSWARGLVGL